MAFVHPRSRQSFFSGSSVHKEKKQWGEEHWIVNKEYCGKKLLLKKDRRCSLHTHKEKDEVFYVQQGRVLLELGKEKRELNPGDFVHIPADTPHRFTGMEDSEMFEFSTTHREDDSFRTEYSGHVEQERYDRQSALIRSFKKCSVLVVGDVMLDTYFSGSVDRISPEAPIPVVHFREKASFPGGAANAARNIVALGARATLIGLKGKDAPGAELEALLRKGKVRSRLLVDAQRFTTQKQRIVAGSSHQIVRLDFEEQSSPSPAQVRALLQYVERELPKHDVLLLSDYAKGVFSPAVLRACIALARRKKKPVVLDPKPLDASYLVAARGVTLITPNRREALLLTGRADLSAEEAGKLLAGALKTDVLLTLGADGMLLAHPRKAPERFSTFVREVADVSGAGDTVVAVLAVALGLKGKLLDAVDLSNRAAGIAVGKAGTATVTPAELLDVL
ncbi:MAG: PfkB family carbohydrate kinase [Candidatus Peribacteraceae bacterium]|jgi:D-beta-D-heptose 7-phosphate kinase/D-beta-D-heptose 1-phosphate adenosyltransferase|nr:PfkB family carbohydrate kinase [Candidatus Peribacteraceae bacterium]